MGPVYSGGKWRKELKETKHCGMRTTENTEYKEIRYIVYEPRHFLNKISELLKQTSVMAFEPLPKL